MTSRERVYRTLDFELPDGERVPRQLWALPWADLHFPGARAAINAAFPDDIGHAWGCIQTPVNDRTKGGSTDIGLYIDEWGCIFENRQNGIIGEVKTPIVQDWADTSKVRFPEDALTLDIAGVNAFRRESERFILAGTCPRPFERLQFIRGSENLYMDLAHAAGKKIFMHSDGCILDIYPDLIEMGLDAINSQIFCMGVDRLAAYKGRITFWGEMDRQHILPSGTEEQVIRAVQDIRENLYSNGGVIAQCEFGPGAKPGNVRAMFAAWDSAL